jgi:hypothetical protein
MSQGFTTTQFRATDDNAIHDNVPNEITAIAEKALGAAGDFLIIEDSAASNVKKRLLVGNLPGAQLSVLEQPLGRKGAVALGASTLRWYTQSNKTISGIYICLSTASSSGVVTVDVHMDGITVFTTQTNRPELAVAALVSAIETPDVTVFNAGSYLNVEVDAEGTGAADLLVVVRYQEA